MCLAQLSQGTPAWMGQVSASLVLGPSCTSPPNFLAKIHVPEGVMVRQYLPEHLPGATHEPGPTEHSEPSTEDSSLLLHFSLSVPPSTVSLPPLPTMTLSPSWALVHVTTKFGTGGFILPESKIHMLRIGVSGLTCPLNLDPLSSMPNAAQRRCQMAGVNRVHALTA